MKNHMRFFFRILIVLICNLVSVIISVEQFVSEYGTGTANECITSVLSNIYFILILMPVVILCMTYDRDVRIYDYMKLTRYRHVKAYIGSRIKKSLFCAVFSPISFFVILLVYLRIADNPAIYMEDSGLVSFINIYQLSNIIIFYVLLISFREMIRGLIAKQGFADTLIIGGIIFNLILYKLNIPKLIVWLPWWHINYIDSGYAVAGYRIYFFYWLLLAMLQVILLKTVERKRNYLAEEDNKYRSHTS